MTLRTKADRTEAHRKSDRRRDDLYTGGFRKGAFFLVATVAGIALERFGAHEELEDATKTGLMHALAKAAQQVAGKAALDITNTAQLRDVCLAAARLYGWKGESQVNVAVNAEKAAVVVCTEEQRQRLIALREKLLAEQAPRAAITPI